MSRLQQHSLSQDKFLMLASNVLFKSVLEAPRTTAKNICKAVSEGKQVSLMSVRMEDETELRLNLSLDHSEFCGKLNYSAFRTSLALLVAGISEQLKAEKEVQVFTEEVTGVVLFGVPAVTEDAGQVNVMMLAADFSGAGSVELKLQYMDPQQFRNREMSATQ